MGYALVVVIVALGVALTNRPLTNGEWDDILEIDDPLSPRNQARAEAGLD